MIKRESSRSTGLHARLLTGSSSLRMARLKPTPPPCGRGHTTTREVPAATRVINLGGKQRQHRPPPPSRANTVTVVHAQLVEREKQNYVVLDCIAILPTVHAIVRAMECAGHKQERPRAVLSCPAAVLHQEHILLCLLLLCLRACVERAVHLPCHLPTLAGRCTAQRLVGCGP